MRTPVRLKADSSFTLSLFGRSRSAQQFAWVQVVGHAGKATIKVVDGANDEPLPFELASPANGAQAGVFGCSVRAHAGDVSTVTIRTGSEVGFQGEVHFELLGVVPGFDEIP